MNNSNGSFRCISFLSDFGSGDETVACCKGVLLQRGISLPLVDISHDVPPFDIISGGWMLAGAALYLPMGIHLAVVDPGVGTDRSILILESKRGDLFVGPDNGLLLPAAKRLGGVEKAWKLRPEHFESCQVSPTFHARDVMAPVVADLAAGVLPSNLGEGISEKSLHVYPLAEPARDKERISGAVARIDTFGTVRTNIPWKWIDIGKEGGLRISRSWLFSISLGKTFSDVELGDLVILEDSWGYLSIAVNRGKAADVLGFKVGDPISVEYTM